MALSVLSRRLKSRKNEERWLMGPPRLALIIRLEKSGLLLANGLRELKTPLLSFKPSEPRYLSVPGLVRISMRPNPKRSNSAEKGFWLMRISRIDSLGGNEPPLKPSM